MTLFYKTLRADTLGTTALSIESIGEITFNKYATRLIALLAQVVSTGGLTTAEALMGKIIIDSQDLRINGLEIDAGTNLGGGPSTNEQAVCVPPVKINLLRECSGGNKVGFRYDAIVPEPTSEVACQITAIYDDGDVPDEVVEAILRGFPLVTDHFMTGADDEIGDALSEDLDDTFDIPGAFTKLNRVIVNVSPDAVGTAEEHFLGCVNLAGPNTTLPDILPQEIPLPALNPTLGTAIGIPVQAKLIDFPLWIDKGVNTQTIAPNVLLNQVTTGANAVSVSLGMIV